MPNRKDELCFYSFTATLQNTEPDTEPLYVTENLERQTVLTALSNCNVLQLRATLLEYLPRHLYSKCPVSQEYKIIQQDFINFGQVLDLLVRMCRLLGTQAPEKQT